MACNSCESDFQPYLPVVVSILKSGTSALLYVQNQGSNIVLIRRILLCYQLPGGGGGTLYLRPSPDPISWAWVSTYLEAGTTALYYTLKNLAPGTIVQAQAEYTEIDGRSRSCTETM